MVCTRCNYSFDGETCPICGTTISKEDINKFNNEPQNNDVKFFTQNDNNNISKCLRCSHTYIGNACSNCGYIPNINNFQAQQGGNFYPTKKALSILPSIYLTLAIVLVILISFLLIINFIGEDNLQNFGLLPKDPVVGNDGKENDNSSNSSKIPENDKTDGKEIIKKGQKPLLNGISYNEYKNITIGMSYAQVSYLIGGDGQLSNEEKNKAGETEYTFVWPGENNNEGYVTITFIDKKLTKITQQGIFE